MHVLYSKNEILAENNFLKNSIIELYTKLKEEVDDFCFLEDRCYFVNGNTLFESSFCLSDDSVDLCFLNNLMDGVNAVCATANGLYVKKNTGGIFSITPGGAEYRKTSLNKSGGFYYSKNKVCFIFFNGVNMSFSSDTPGHLNEVITVSEKISWRPIDAADELIWYGYDDTSNIMYVYNKKSIFSYILEPKTIGVFTALINGKSFLSVVNRKEGNVVKCSIVDLEKIITSESRFIFIPQGNVVCSTKGSVLDSEEIYAVINSIKIINMGDDYIVKVG